MKKRIFSLISLALAVIMMMSLTVACKNNGQETKKVSLKDQYFMSFDGIETSVNKITSLIDPETQKSIKGSFDLNVSKLSVGGQDYLAVPATLSGDYAYSTSDRTASTSIKLGLFGDSLDASVYLANDSTLYVTAPSLFSKTFKYDNTDTEANIEDVLDADYNALFDAVISIMKSAKEDIVEEYLTSEKIKVADADAVKLTLKLSEKNFGTIIKNLATEIENNAVIINFIASAGEITEAEAKAKIAEEIDAAEFGDSDDIIFTSTVTKLTANDSVVDFTVNVIPEDDSELGIEYANINGTATINVNLSDTDNGTMKIESTVTDKEAKADFTIVDSDGSTTTANIEVDIEKCEYVDGKSFDIDCDCSISASSENAGDIVINASIKASGEFVDSVTVVSPDTTDVYTVDSEAFTTEIMTNLPTVLPNIYALIASIN